MMTQKYEVKIQEANRVDQVSEESTKLRVQPKGEPTIDRSIKIVELQNFETIQYACNAAYKHHKFIGIAGDPGHGKTIGLEYFKKHHKNVFMVTVTASMSVKDFWITVFESIYEYRIKVVEDMAGTIYKENQGESDHDWEVRFKEFNQLESVAKESDLQMRNIRANPNIHFIIKQIIRNLNSTGGLLIFDEAGKVKTTRFLEMIHELRDATKEHVGIIIAGPEYFKRQLQVWVNKSVNGIPELWSRIQVWYSLDSPSREDIKAFCHAYGVVDKQVIQEFQTTRNYRLLYNRVINYLEQKAEEQSFENGD